MPPFDHPPSAFVQPRQQGEAHQFPLPPSRGSLNPPRYWQPTTWYDTAEVVEYEGLRYQCTGAHVSGESLTVSMTSFPIPKQAHGCDEQPRNALATWIPVEKPDTPAPPGESLALTAPFPQVQLCNEGMDDHGFIPPTEPPPEYPTPPGSPPKVYADASVQTDISFPPDVTFPAWMFTAFPQSGSMTFAPPPGNPWLPTQATFSGATQLQHHPFSASQAYIRPPQPPIYAPMPLHLPLRLPPSLESVLAPISDPLDARYRSARTAERAKQGMSSFRGEVAGERVVRSHACGVWAFGGAGERDRALESEREAAWREWGTRPETWLRAARARRAAYAVPGAVRPPIRWVLVEEGQKIPEDALQTGAEATGEPLYSTRVWWQGGLHLGKAANHIYNYASISWDSQEHTTPTFEVLCGPSTHVQWLEIPHGTRVTPSLFHTLSAVEGGREATGTFIFVAQGEYGFGGAVGLHPGKASAGDDHACIGYGGGEVWIRPFRLLVYTPSSMG
ncbi:hypothetical protein DACRYDRAFT_101090 [Dacryopinax primogenitus]|uniref:Uncharacterized protein n=1 Tax=Dacryopinax primogenitus (strain DJM 731) TaxID=1858805 RepID=M5G8A5_DACPD|nr:uncharacterized protein DACRYDRAFT_101090 [Dacryopinax primogenitus]EJT99987.1 hypothetical protein DACRYDRAFT_101090 [Dacryopinax primogenitus]